MIDIVIVILYMSITEKNIQKAVIVMLELLTF